MSEPELTVRVVEPAERPVLERLWQMFRHDLSEFRGVLPHPDGTFRNERLLAASDDPAWAGYLIWKQDRPVGLALVRALDQPVRVLNAFFVVRGLRRTGVGSRTVRQVLAKHPGRWEVAFQADNETAARFWRRVAAEIAGTRWSEERRAVPARPELPPDVWISFSTTDPRAEAEPSAVGPDRLAGRSKAMEASTRPDDDVAGPAQVGAHIWTVDERREQLAALQQLCARMARILAQHGDAWASHFASRAALAEKLLRDGFSQPDLDELGSAFPALPWLNPKAIDNGLTPPVGWEGEVARLHEAARAVALNVRSVATY